MAGKWQKQDVTSPALKFPDTSKAHEHLFNDVSGNLESSARSFPVHFKEYKPTENKTGDILFCCLHKISDVSEIQIKLFLIIPLEQLCHLQSLTWKTGIYKCKSKSWRGDEKRCSEMKPDNSLFTALYHYINNICCNVSFGVMNIPDECDLWYFQYFIRSQASLVTVFSSQWLFYKPVIKAIVIEQNKLKRWGFFLFF